MLKFGTVFVMLVILVLLRIVMEALVRRVTRARNRCTTLLCLVRASGWTWVSRRAMLLCSLLSSARNSRKSLAPHLDSGLCRVQL